MERHSNRQQRSNRRNIGRRRTGYFDFLALILIIAGIILLFYKNLAGIIFIILGIIKYFIDIN